jgi:hypothetical protein
MMVVTRSIECAHGRSGDSPGKRSPLPQLKITARRFASQHSDLAGSVAASVP